jgi:pectate lyase
VLYNWGYESCYGGEANQKGDRRKPPIPFSTINMVANYYKAGPATKKGLESRLAKPSSRDGMDDAGSWYVAGNHVVGSPEVTSDNWLGVHGNVFTKLNAPWKALPIRQQTAEDAYVSVLKHVGCSLPARDSLDKRIIEEAKNGTGTHGRNGIIDSPKDVGGWPELKSGPVPVDGDGDGMSDEWEIGHGLDPKDPADGAKDKDGDGYSKVEEFLNGTDPGEAVDYSKPENNVSSLHELR